MFDFGIFVDSIASDSSLRGRWIQRAWPAARSAFVCPAPAGDCAAGGIRRAMTASAEQTAHSLLFGTLLLWAVVGAPERDVGVQEGGNDAVGLHPRYHIIP